MNIGRLLRRHARWGLFPDEHCVHLQRQRIGEWACPYCGEYEGDCDEHPSWRPPLDHETVSWVKALILKAALKAAGGVTE